MYESKYSKLLTVLLIAGIILRSRDKKVVIPAWDELDNMTQEEKDAPTVVHR